MSYLVLARKWRPQGFADIIGQDPIVKVLSNAIEQDKIAHAYVFSGPRGVGKTSTARILAKALNCKEGPTPNPCGKCPSCLAITGGSDVDVMEIDGASNNSVDDIRDLRERVKYAPSGGKRKIYIIDEVHMLSTSAFNALLKTLEEPPPHVIFVLATTEARKVPLTVMSRCQHLPFRRVSTTTIKARLKQIVDTEGIGVTDGALTLVARAADGSIRDSLTILDQVTSFSSKVDEADVKDLLDIADFSSILELARAIIEGEREAIVSAVQGLVDSGADLRAFTKELIKFFRDLLVVNLVNNPEGLLDLSAEEMDSVKKVSAGVSEEHLTLIVSELVKAESEVRLSFSPRVALEMALFKISYLSTFRSVNEAIAAITKLAPGSIVSDAPKAAPASGAPQAELDQPVAPKRPPARKKKPAEEMPQDEPDDIVLTPDDDEPEAPAVEQVNNFYNGEELRHAIEQRIDDPRISSKLSAATADLNNDVLTLSFNDTEAELCAKPFKDNPAMIEKIASELRARPTKIVIQIKQARQTPKVTLTEKAKSDATVKEALDLFDGRIVNVKEYKDKPQGG